MWEQISPATALIQQSNKHTRTISSRVEESFVTLPAMSQFESDNWSKALAYTGLWERGQVANLGDVSLISTSAENALNAFLVGLGFSPSGLKTDMNALACSGSVFHHDAQSYGNKVFCVIWLSDDTEWELYFPFLDRRIPLKYGTMVLFDAGQPHGVVAPGDTIFNSEKFEGNTGVFGSLDVTVTATVREIMGVTASSRRGRKGFAILNREGTQEDLDEITGNWHVRKLR